MTKRLLVTCVVLAGLQAPQAEAMGWAKKKLASWWYGEKKEQAQPQQQTPAQPVIQEQAQPEETVEVMSLRGTTMYTVPKSHLKGVKKITPAPVQPVVQEIPAQQVVAAPVQPTSSQTLDLTKPLAQILAEEQNEVTVSPAQPLPCPETIPADLPELTSLATDNSKAIIPHVDVKKVVTNYYSAQKPAISLANLKKIVREKMEHDAFNPTDAQRSLQTRLDPALVPAFTIAALKPTIVSDITIPSWLFDETQNQTPVADPAVLARIAAEKKLENQEIMRLSGIDNSYQLPENWHPEDHYTEYTTEEYATQKAEQAAAEQEEIKRLSGIDIRYSLPKNWHRAQFNKEFPCTLTAHGDSTTPKRKAPKLNFIPNPNYEGHLALLHGTFYASGDFE